MANMYFLINTEFIKMSVGDLKNNLRKLQTSLRGVKYEKDLDLDSVSKGAVLSFLPIYHYLFLDYSVPIAEKISNINIEMSGKTDVRFVEAMYKVLREMFTYKPPITKDQLFATGFVERKVIMCTEIIGLVRDKHKSLVPRAAPKARPLSGNQANRLGPRPQPIAKIAKAKETEIIETIQAVPLETRPKCAPTNDPLHIQVVNETRSQSAADAQVAHEIRSAVASSLAATDSMMEEVQWPRTVTINPHAVVREISDVQAEPEIITCADIPSQHPLGGPSAPWDGMRAVVVTSGEQEGQQADGSGYNPALYGEEQDDSDNEDPSSAPLYPRPIDMVAMTPARPASGPPASGGPRVVTGGPRLAAHHVTAHTTNRQTPDPLTDVMNRLTQSMQDLTSRVLGLENRLGVVEGLLTLQRETTEVSGSRRGHPEVAGSRRGQEVTPQLLETMLARMTLVENAVAMVTAQRDAHPAPSPRPLTRDHSGQLSGVDNRDTVSRVTPPLPSPIPTLALSPIPQSPPPTVAAAPTPSAATPSLTATTPAATTLAATLAGTGPTADGHERRWSSTPTSAVTAGGDDTDAHRVTPGVGDVSQAERIKHMLRQTEDLLNIQVNSPVRSAAK